MQFGGNPLIQFKMLLTLKEFLDFSKFPIFNVNKSDVDFSGIQLRCKKKEDLPTSFVGFGNCSFLNQKYMFFVYS